MKKKRKLKKQIKYIIYILTTILLILFIYKLICIYENMYKRDIDNCIKNGYSKYSCIKDY